MDYEFVEWSVVSGEAVLSSTSAAIATFTMPASNVEIKGEFRLSADGATRLTTIEYKLKESRDTRTFLAFSTPEGVTINSVRVVSGSIDRALVYDNDDGYWTMPVLLEGAAESENMKFYYTVDLNGATSAETYKELPFTGLAKNETGANYYENGEVTGQVWRMGDYDTKYQKGLIIHKDMLSTNMEYPGSDYTVTTSWGGSLL